MNIYTTMDRVQIRVEPGSKSDFDFIVKYKEPGKRERTPKHVHIAVDLLLKKEGNYHRTMDLINFIINEIIEETRPIDFYPPVLQVFSTKKLDWFSELDEFGEYSIEFLLVVIELIVIQEKTNYPNGVLNQKIFEMLFNDADIFSVINAASFR